MLLGISGLDGFADPGAILLSSAALFAGSVRDAARVSRNKLHNNLHYAVLDDGGGLIAGTGRLPLRSLRRTRPAAASWPRICVFR